MNHKESPQDQIKPIIELFFSGQVQEALDAVEVLIKDYPNDPLLYNISGICYKTIGKLDEAVKSFEKALTIKSDYAEVHYRSDKRCIKVVLKLGKNMKSIYSH